MQLHAVGTIVSIRPRTRELLPALRDAFPDVASPAHLTDAELANAGSRWAPAGAHVKVTPTPSGACVDRDRPTRAARGVVHGDLCPENLVVTPTGPLVSIDNERGCINFLDHDLARTWTRWPMTPEEEHTLESRYREQGGSLPAQPAQLAWRVCTTVKSASTLRRTPGTGPDTSRALLERVLTDGVARP